MLAGCRGLDFFVSLAFMPLSFAIVGPLSKVVSMERFPGGGIVPVLLGAVAMAAPDARDEIANPFTRRRTSVGVRAP